MITQSARLLLPAVLIVCALPISLRAETFTFKNDCRVSLIVQVATVQRGVLKRDQCLLKAGETTPKMPLMTDKVITVYDGKNGRVLFRDALRISKTPLNYSIVPDMRVAGQVRMIPIKPSEP